MHGVKIHRGTTRHQTMEHQYHTVIRWG